MLLHVHTQTHGFTCRCTVLYDVLFFLLSLGKHSRWFPAGLLFLCATVLTLSLHMEWNRLPFSSAQLPVLYHSSSIQRALSTHPALCPSPVQMTIFSSSAAILEFVADWLLLVVWAAISPGMSGLLSNHSRVPAQDGWLGALITTLSLL